MRKLIRLFSSRYSWNLFKNHPQQILLNSLSLKYKFLCSISLSRKYSEKIILKEPKENKKNESLNNSANSVIYCGGLTSQIKGVKIFSCTSSVGGIVLQPFIVQNILVGENLAVSIALLTTVGFFTFVTPILIHLLTRKYVTQMQYDSSTDTYTATTLSFFLKPININFKIKDVFIPDRLPMFTTMIIKEKPVFVLSDCFFDTSHYIKMMGYDKPIDLKLTKSDTKH